ncbi:hypothetical protein [uncultured Polaribacter sp.]|uniref:hypothetical protein n=1 Tax=uncultured Polaribacter sp. TaxID=174711 RepID=UPI0026269A36|nr:hypothetical protein [uncultured Polaribacter sp.]
MKSKIKFLFLPLLLFSVVQLSAQLDSNTNNKEKGKVKAIVLNSTKEVKKPTSINLDSNLGFKGAYKIEEEKNKRKEAEEAFNNKGILTREQLNNLRIKEMYGKRTVEKVDSFQGNFLTLSKAVTLSFRDFGAIDGDIIAIYHNDILVVEKATLNQHYKSFDINLDKGNNKIEIVALNQGRLGANTAQYKLVDKNGSKIASQYWFLATGAKAIFSVSRN